LTGRPLKGKQMTLPINEIKHTCRVCGKVLTDDNWPKSWKMNYQYKCSLCHYDYIKAIHRKHPERRVNRELRKRYGITLDEYNAVLAEQGYKCSICGRPSSMFAKRLHVDHNHATGGIRGLLCYGCNKYLGQINDSTTVLKRAINYLGNKQ